MLVNTSLLFPQFLHHSSHCYVCLCMWCTSVFKVIIIYILNLALSTYHSDIWTSQSMWLKDIIVKVIVNWKKDKKYCPLLEFNVLKDSNIKNNPTIHLNFIKKICKLNY